ncbi:MAG: hypothetical protein DRO67_02775 [Candidatus Asgardarchaeum californiense]|nr:MAG: hypothetical protein DRO67_02775 [Candidatus Asgardarchaeum californiense]
MYKKAVSGIMLTLLFICMLNIEFNIKKVDSSYTTTIYFDPPDYIFNANDVYVGFKFNATVRVSDVENLVAWQVCIYYNRSILEVSRYFEPAWDPEYVFYGKETIFGRFNIRDFCVGACVYPVTSENAFSGSGKLVIIEFEIITIPSTGEAYSSILDINNEDTYLLDFDGNEIPALKEDGYYLITWSVHDVAINLDAPDFYDVDSSILLNVTVWNLGLSNESNVEIYLLINDTVIAFVEIQELLSGHFYLLSYLWRPTVGGTVNVTAYVPPVLGENATINNFVTKFVKWDGTIYIRADGSISPPNAPIITYDNVTYTLTGNITSFADGIIVQKDNIILNGAGYTIRGAWWSSSGIVLSKIVNVTIKNFRIENFSKGVLLSDSSKNRICENNIEFGLSLDNSSNNWIIENNITNCGGKIDVHRKEIWVTGGLNLIDSSNNFFVDNVISGPANARALIGVYIGQGIKLWWASNNNTFSANTIQYNYYGLSLHGGPSSNKFYHNNFIENERHVDGTGQLTSWDNGYPSGGNYWSDYNGTDYYSGPYQNETGKDGIGDTPYTIDGDNVDRYPLMHPWGLTPPAFANVTVDTHPPALNLRSKGQWLIVFIELPGYNLNCINVSTIMLNGTIPVDLSAPIAIGDYDNDTIPDLMVCFNWTDAAEYVLSTGIVYGNVTLEVSGKLYSGIVFTGTDTLLVSSLVGDVNIDGAVDIQDILVAALSFGSYPAHPRWNPNADFTKDGYIGIDDICLTARNFGKQA